MYEVVKFTVHIGLFGRALDWGSKGCKFENHWCRWLVSLSKALYPLLSQEDMIETLMTGM